MGEIRTMYNILVESLKGRNHLEDTGIDGGIILKLVFWKEFEKCGLDSCGSG
jgi:hypothetical protein